MTGGGPKPLSFPPSEYWDGNDGSWSSFALRVGNPEQTVRVLPSTAGQATFVVSPLGCPATEPANCTQTRGETFDSSNSKSWKSIGNYTLGLEQNLGYNEIATYGFDALALGLSDATGSSTLQSQVIADIETDDYYIGIFGLGHQPYNFTNFQDPHPSFLTTMRSKNWIPSLSWAYTAGAQYRLKGVFGSLTFGGYDASRFVPNNVSFSLAPDISRDIVVGLQSITAKDANGSTTSLLPSPILTFIDSTVPYIYLPPEACQLFENAFGLVWNKTLELYLVNDTLHDSLLAKNATFTFQIGDTTTGGPTIDIVLPYASFDLIGQYPLVDDTTRYFPLQKGNETQYTLGRTFLQEAYLITNYEHSNFSVSQCLFEDGVPLALITIPPAATTSSSHVSRGLIIGASIGATLFLLLIILLSTWAIRRRRAKKQITQKSDITAPFREGKISTAFSIQEIAHNSLFYGDYRELADSGKIELLDETRPSGSAKEISELPPEPPPVYHELMAETVSYGPLKLQKYSSTSSTKSKTGIYVSTKILTNSRSSEGGSSTPRVETIITSSTRHSFKSDQPSRSQSPWPKPLDLDRPLPPTPISESPQVSPITPASKRSGRRRLPIKAPPNSTSTSGTFDYVSPTSTTKNAGSLSSSGRSPLSETSMELEIVIPPGYTEPRGTIYSSPTSLDGEGTMVAEFF
ncbi:hypothetical protein JMJ35_003476 [Cladonia borealis]|uniref:Peptidase A1 domain-containing protein n=1 Tax=Cladonia borealis TaxID=184061 RepID=A0AA39R502_9LECA|nr:hypothetical protein JMJ35_003476 [Cladonia borealis]